MIFHRQNQLANMTNPLKSLFLSAAFWLVLLLTSLQPTAAQIPPLHVSDDGHSLVTRDGKPFLYLADTAWELLARLNQEEVLRYLDDRKAKGFTVIQTAFLALHQGPNALGVLPVDYARLRPITNRGASYDWWDHADFILSEAAKRGFYVAIAPFRQQLAPKKKGDAVRYGRFLGRRYRRFTNLIWTVGFDPSVAQINAQQELYRALALGIAQGVSGGKADYGRVLMTFHPSGPNASSRWFHADAFLDFNLIQTGHGRDTESWKMIAEDYGRGPAKPVLDAEATYEAHPLANVRDANGQNVLSDDSDIRRYAYWNLFAGACGHAYGHHSVWQMHQPARGGGYGAVASWSDALNAPGAGQMRPVRTLLESRPFWNESPTKPCWPIRSWGPTTGRPSGGGRTPSFTAHKVARSGWCWARLRARPCGRIGSTRATERPPALGILPTRAPGSSVRPRPGEATTGCSCWTTRGKTGPHRGSNLRKVPVRVWT